MVVGEGKGKGNVRRSPGKTRVRAGLGQRVELLGGEGRAMYLCSPMAKG